MGIEQTWYDAEKTIILNDYQGKWTWDGRAGEIR
jgi:hypothetical protein